MISALYDLFLSTSGVVTDTRKFRSDCLFVALKGPRFNGNTFAEQALASGAKYAIVDEAEFVHNEQCVLVDDGLVFLQELARHHRRQFNIPVIAITGSNGKTTTKELTAAVLSSNYRTHFTKGNFNNHIGVPLTLLEMPKDTEVAIIEMGANHQKEIAALCQIAEPSHGLITNIGKAHLEGFGGIAGVKKGKGELYDYLADQAGVVFINTDEKFLSGMAEKVKHKIHYQRSENPSVEVRAYEIKVLQDTPFVEVGFLDRAGAFYTAETHLMGQYNVDNIMTAIALGKYFKVPAGLIRAAIAAYVPANNRSEIKKIGTNTFYLDAYNANPTSTRAALNYFDGINVENKVVVLGDMLELGEYSEQEHRRIIDDLLSMHFQTVAVVGQAYGKVVQASDNIPHFPDVERLKQWFEEQNMEHSTILLKGSRGIGLERLVIH